EAGEGAADLADVNVHPARLLASEGGERRAVGAEERQAQAGGRGGTAAGAARCAIQGQIRPPGRQIWGSPGGRRLNYIPQWGNGRQTGAGRLYPAASGSSMRNSVEGGPRGSGGARRKRPPWRATRWAARGTL